MCATQPRVLQDETGHAPNQLPSFGTRHHPQCHQHRQFRPGGVSLLLVCISQICPHERMLSPSARHQGHLAGRGAGRRLCRVTSWLGSAFVLGIGSDAVPTSQHSPSISMAKGGLVLNAPVSSPTERSLSSAPAPQIQLIFSKVCFYIEILSSRIKPFTFWS